MLALSFPPLYDTAFATKYAVHEQEWTLGGMSCKLSIDAGLAGLVLALEAPDRAGVRNIAYHARI